MPNMLERWNLRVKIQRHFIYIQFNEEKERTRKERKETKYIWMRRHWLRHHANTSSTNETFGVSQLSTVVCFVNNCVSQHSWQFLYSFWGISEKNGRTLISNTVKIEKKDAKQINNVNTLCRCVVALSHWYLTVFPSCYESVHVVIFC